ncbi:MAG: ArnT family glycosyltransferase [Anaerolineae bacterium]
MSGVSRSVWTRYGTQCVISMLLVLLLGLPSLTYPFGRDQGEYATIATEMLRGKVIYRDVFNVKPPATHLVHALSLVLFGHAMLSVRTLDLLWQVATALVILLIGQRVTQRWYGGPLAAVLYAVWYYGFDFWNTAQTDGWQTLPVALGVLAYLRARETDRPWAYLACGAGIGVGVLFKYPIGILAPLLMVHSLSLPKSAGWRGAALIAAGALAPVALCAVAFQAQGALVPFAASQVKYILQYSGASRSEFGYIWMIGFVLRLGTYPTFLFWTCCALCLALGLRARALGVRERPWVALAWLAAAAFSYLGQAKGYRYHGLPLLAPGALLASYGVAAVFQGDRPRKTLQLVLTAIVEISIVLPVFAYGSQILRTNGHGAIWDVVRQRRELAAIYVDPVTTYDGVSEPGFSFRAQSASAARIASSAPAGDPIFIWGFEPTIYFLSERPPSSRFLYNLMLHGDWAWPELQEQLMADLAAHPPAYIVVASDDALPLVTGSMEDSASALLGFPELKNLIDESYDYETSFENLALYRRLP